MSTVLIHNKAKELLSKYPTNYLDNLLTANNSINVLHYAEKLLKIPENKQIYNKLNTEIFHILISLNDSIEHPYSDEDGMYYVDDDDYEVDDDDDDDDYDLEKIYTHMYNEKVQPLIDNNCDINDINDNTIIISKKYNNIKDIKNDIKYCISYTARNKDIKLKKYLEDFLFENHYKTIKKDLNLTNRLKNLNSNICYNGIYRNIFNNNYNDNIKKYDILPLNFTNIIKSLHCIDSVLTGCFIDYLIRRIICELLNIEFNDNRSNHLDVNKHICNNDDCIFNIYDCILSFCRIESKKLTKDTIAYKTIDIIKEIFITSLSHIEAFSQCPNQDNINKMLKILNNNILLLYTPLQLLCKIIINNKNNIKLNPAFGGKLNTPVEKYNIPSDADLIIDDCLIDIKCTKEKSNSKCSNLLQLLGYSALTFFHNVNNKKINKIMILNVLEGTIYKIDISNITDKNYENYIKFLCNDL
tara:strand:+ start:59 stop:1468 length:1410 start_codon:yes stop_codon:yes gene_type:complete